MLLLENCSSELVAISFYLSLLSVVKSLFWLAVWSLPGIQKQWAKFWKEERNARERLEQQQSVVVFVLWFFFFFCIL